MEDLKKENRKTAWKYLRIALLAIAGLVLVVFFQFFGKDQLQQRFGYTLSPPARTSFAEFMDVGQGDCTLLYSKGYCALIDTGTVYSAQDVCLELDKMGIRQIDVVLISHLHTDHIGGLEQLTENYHIENLILPALSEEEEGYEIAVTARDEICEAGGSAFIARQGMYFRIGEFEVTVIGCYYELEEENDRSVFCMAKIGAKKILFTGDAETQAEESLLHDRINFSCDILKVAHHGSKAATGSRFLSMAAPDAAVISVGEYNTYGHPSDRVLQSLKSAGARVFRTDESGCVTIRFENGKYRFETENGS